MFNKSSYSMNNGDCVEVDTSWHSAVVGVRDTKEAPLGDERIILGFSREAWREFTKRIKEIS